MSLGIGGSGFMTGGERLIVGMAVEVGVTGGESRYCSCSCSCEWT